MRKAIMFIVCASVLTASTVSGYSKDSPQKKANAEMSFEKNYKTASSVMFIAAPVAFVNIAADVAPPAFRTNDAKGVTVKTFTGNFRSRGSMVNRTRIRHYWKATKRNAAKRKVIPIARE